MGDRYERACGLFLVAYRRLLCSVHTDLVDRRQGAEEGATAVTAVTAAVSPAPCYVPTPDDVVAIPQPPLSAALHGIAEAAHGLQQAHAEELGERLRFMRRDQEREEWDFGPVASDRFGLSLPEHERRGDDFRRFHDVQSVPGLALELIGHARRAASRIEEKAEDADTETLGALTLAGTLALVIIAPSARDGERQAQAAAANASLPRDPATAQRHQLWIDRAREIHRDAPFKSVPTIGREIAADLPLGFAASADTIRDVLYRRKEEWQTLDD